MDVIPALCWLPTPRQLGAKMPDSKNLERLLGMVRDALAEADRQNNTLVARCWRNVRKRSVEAASILKRPA